MYLSSADGTMLVYPSTQQIACEEDTYDARLRPWYISASTGPKSVMLVLDVSGSMSGSRISILKDSAKNLISTLSLGDFVGVVAFSSEVFSLTGNSMWAATEENKNRLADAIDTLQADGGTLFHIGFQKAFQVMDESKLSDSFTTCTVALIFLTDGQPTDSVFQTELVMSENAGNYPSLTLFTFSLGEGSNQDIPKQLACQYDGIWTPVSNTLALRTQMSFIFDYYTTLNSGSEGRVFWSEPYLDAFGAGMMVTASVAIYAKPSDYSSPNFQHPYLIGIANIDVLLEDLERVEPDYEVVLQSLNERNKACTLFTADPCLLHNLRNKVYGSGEDLGNDIDRSCGPAPANCTEREDLCLSNSTSSVLPKLGQVCEGTATEITVAEYQERVCCGSCGLVSGSLGAGAIAGIVIGALVGVAVLLGLAYCCCCMGQSKGAGSAPHDVAMNAPPPYSPH